VLWNRASSSTRGEVWYHWSLPLLLGATRAGTHSLTGCTLSLVIYLLNCCWLSPAQWFLFPSPTGLTAIFYFLTALGAFRMISLIYVIFNSKIMCCHVNVLRDKDLLNKRREWKELKCTVAVRSIKIPHLYFYAHYPDL
jgi:hypothetical protein